MFLPALPLDYLRQIDPGDRIRRGRTRPHGSRVRRGTRGTTSR